MDVPVGYLPSVLLDSRTDWIYHFTYDPYFYSLEMRVVWFEPIDVFESMIHEAPEQLGLFQPTVSLDEFSCVVLSNVSRPLTTMRIPS
jgi:hypothetical protein